MKVANKSILMNLSDHSLVIEDHPHCSTRSVDQIMSIFLRSSKHHTFQSIKGDENKFVLSD